MHACQMIYKFQTVSLEQLQCLGVSSALNGYGMGLRRVLQTLRWICQPAGTQTSKELKWRQQVSLSIHLINNDKRAGRYEGLLTVRVQIGNQVPTSVSHVIALPMPSRNLRERSYSKIQNGSRAWHDLKFGTLCLRNGDIVFGTEADGAVSSDLNAMSSARELVINRHFQAKWSRRVAREIENMKYSYYSMSQGAVQLFHRSAAFNKLPNAIVELYVEFFLHFLQSGPGRVQQVL